MDAMYFKSSNVRGMEEIGYSLRLGKWQWWSELTVLLRWRKLVNVNLKEIRWSGYISWLDFGHKERGCCFQSLSCVWLFVVRMDCSTPGSCILHQLPEFAQAHIHWVGDAIQPSHPLSPSCPRALSLSHHLLASGGQSIGALASAPVLPVNIQDWFPLGWTGLISLLSRGLWRVFSSTTIWKYQFFNTQPSLWSSSYISAWLLEKPQLYAELPCLLTIRTNILANELPWGYGREVMSSVVELSSLSCPEAPSWWYPTES